MNLETKFDVYDKVFFLHNNKMCTSVVKGIKIDITSCPIEIATEVTYLCSDNNDAQVFIKVPEETAYSSKEELLQSL